MKALGLSQEHVFVGLTNWLIFMDTFSCTILKLQLKSLMVFILYNYIEYGDPLNVIFSWLSIVRI